MKKLTQLLPLIAITVLLSACSTTTYYGMPKDSWNKLSPQQQIAVANSYFKAQASQNCRVQSESTTTTKTVNS